MSDYKVNVEANLIGFERLDKIDAQIRRMQKSNKIKIQLDTSGIGKTAGLSSKQFETAGVQAGKSFQAGLERSYKTGKFIATSSKMSAQLKLFDKQENKNIQTAAKSLSEYNVALNNLNRHYNPKDSFKLDTEGLKKNASILKDSADTFKNSMSQVRDETTRTVSTFDRIASANKLHKYWKDNTKLTKSYTSALQDLELRASKATTTGELAEVNKEFRALDAQITSKGLKGRSIFSELGRGVKQIGQFVYTYGAIQKGMNLIVGSISELKEIDTILTEISKTSDLTDTQIKELGKDSFSSASVYGKTAKDYLTGIQEMSRSGFYGKQAEELSKLSILGQAAGDMNAEVSNSYLLATNAAYAYQGSVKKLNTVLDGQNMITNRNSVNMNDMAEATSKAASMASQTGVEVNELSAVIGTAVARTKQEGNVIGTSLKSLFVNLQDTSNKKIVGTFDALGISQKKFVNGSEQLKTPIELLKELSVAYNALPEGSVLKADVLRNIGQKRQANVLAAVLGGMGSGDYDKMLKDYSQGMGSAAIEAEKSANNWQGSLNKLSNSWTEFISNFAQTDQIVGSINVIDGLVSGLDALVGAITPLGTIGAGVGVTAFLKNLD